MTNGNNALRLPISINDFNQEFIDARERVEYIANFFENKVSYIDLGEYKQSSQENNVYFKKELGTENNMYLKYYLYWGVYEKRYAITTVDSGIGVIGNFIKNCQNEYYSNFVVSETKDYMLDDYINAYHVKIKNFDFTLQSANANLIVLIRFLCLLNEQSLTDFIFLEKYNVSKIFPYQKPERYYTKEEYAVYLQRAEQVKKNKPYKYNELEVIMDGAKKHLPLSLYAYYMVALHTGLRSTEIINLEKDCVSKESFDNQEVYWLSSYKYLKGKQKSWQDGTPIKISKKVYSVICEQIERVNSFTKESKKGIENKVFKQEHLKRKLTSLISPGYISTKKKILEEKTGIVGITSHRFRHTFAKLQYDKGVPFEYIRKYLNHQTGDITAGYIGFNKEENSQKYKKFLSMKNVAGGGKGKAVRFQKRLDKVYSNTVFQGMAEDRQSELLEKIADDEGVNVQIMDHGICMLPNQETCPNKYTTVNNCLEEYCNKFIVDEGSIPFVEKLKVYREESLENLERMNFTGVLRAERKRLDNIERVLGELNKNKLEKSEKK